MAIMDQEDAAQEAFNQLALESVAPVPRARNRNRGNRTERSVRSQQQMAPQFLAAPTTSSTAAPASADGEQQAEPDGRKCNFCCQPDSSEGLVLK